MKNNDDIMENFIFDYILRNSEIHYILLDFNDFIINQSISNQDKIDILSISLWNWIIDSNDEINSVIFDYRNNKKIPKLYQILLNFIEKEININDNISTSFLISTTKKELEHIISKISIKIVAKFIKTITKEIKSKKSIFEKFSKDYMDNKEKEEILLFIESYNYIYDENDKKDIEILNNFIKNDLDKKNKILNIK